MTILGRVLVLFLLAVLALAGVFAWALVTLGEAILAECFRMTERLARWCGLEALAAKVREAIEKAEHR